MTEKKEDRLEAALRENLKRRKAQERAREVKPIPSPEPLEPGAKHD